VGSVHCSLTKLVECTCGVDALSRVFANAWVDNNLAVVVAHALGLGDVDLGLGLSGAFLSGRLNGLNGGGPGRLGDWLFDGCVFEGAVEALFLLGAGIIGTGVGGLFLGCGRVQLGAGVVWRTMTGIGVGAAQWRSQLLLALLDNLLN